MSVVRVKGQCSGYQVRVQRGGKRESRFFADDRYGGEALAYRAARAFEERLRARPRKQHRNNSSGTTGIAEYVKVHRSGREYPVVQVYWKEGGQSKCTCLSVDKHGVDDAYRLAREIRDREEKHLGPVAAGPEDPTAVRLTAVDFESHQPRKGEP